MYILLTLPTMRRAYLALDRETFILLLSLKKPMVLLAGSPFYRVLRTHEKIMMSFSLPWKPSTV